MGKICGSTVSGNSSHSIVWYHPGGLLQLVWGRLCSCKVLMAVEWTKHGIYRVIHVGMFVCVCVLCMVCVYVCCVCYACMCTVYVMRVCVLCMLCVYVYCVCYACMCTVYVMRVCVLCMLCVYVYCVCYACMCIVYVMRVCVLCMLFVGMCTVYNMYHVHKCPCTVC